MGAVVVAHVDDLSGLLCATEGGLDDGLGLADEGHHRAVRGFAGINVEQFDALHRLYGVGDGFDDSHVAALAEVGHALDNLFFSSHYVFLRSCGVL